MRASSSARACTGVRSVSGSKLPLVPARRIVVRQRSARWPRRVAHAWHGSPARVRLRRGLRSASGDRKGSAIRRSTSELFGVIRPLRGDVSRGGSIGVLQGRSSLCTPRGRPLPARGGAWAARSLLGAAAGRQSHGTGAGRGDREAAPAALYGRRDRRDAGDGALDRVRDRDPAWDGSTRPARTGAAEPLREITAWRARPCRRQEARPHRGRCRRACAFFCVSVGG